MSLHLLVYRCTLSTICVYATVYLYVCCRVVYRECVYACMCVCMFVCMHGCCAVVYVGMYVCLRCHTCVCVQVTLSLNTLLNRWSGKQGNLVRHHVKVILVCYVGYARYISLGVYVSFAVFLKCQRREQDVTSFALSRVNVVASLMITHQARSKNFSYALACTVLETVKRDAYICSAMFCTALCFSLLRYALSYFAF
jgi:hypothetical protein